jgi:hypothetical protein
MLKNECALSWKLVEDLPGKHVYIHACRVCGCEYGDEFIVNHASMEAIRQIERIAQAAGEEPRPQEALL